MTTVTCGNCEKPNIAAGRACPSCGSTTHDVQLQAELGTVAELTEIRQHRAWGANELTLVGIVYTLLIGILAVTIPLTTWWAKLTFALLAVAALVAMGVWKEPVIAVARRYLAWKGPGQRIR